MNKQKDYIDFEDLMKVDIRVCEVLEVRKIEGTDRLYEMLIDTGIDRRKVVSAIAHQFILDDLIDCCYPFVLNLKPRKIRGVESNAMILLSEDDKGKYYLLDGASIGSIVL